MRKIIINVTIFSIAMAFLESSVVVYLRELYYPEGFDFPLVFMEKHIAITELLREASTIIMLIYLGILAGKTISEKFAYFLYSFAIWDIFYYVFLKFLLGWPESIFTWDLLFLIPVAWVGPVISPVIISLTMIIFAQAIIYFNRKKENVKILKNEWLVLIIGSLVVITAFCWDFTRYFVQQYSLSGFFNLIKNGEIIELSANYIPITFPWLLFWIGEFIILFGIFKYIRRIYINLK
ncbi:MAG: hypothetical protein KAT68_13385 [Bacteroidales bacterium]|nr:hypothetical protein [Bacteroidales bacterium]